MHYNRVAVSFSLTLMIIVFCNGCDDKNSVDFQVVLFPDDAVLVNNGVAPVPSEPAAILINDKSTFDETLVDIDGNALNPDTEIAWDVEAVILVQLEGNCKYSDNRSWWPFLVDQVYIENGKLYLGLSDPARITGDSCVEPFVVVSLQRKNLKEEIVLKWVCRNC